VTEKSRVVTFRLDQATWEFMRELVPYTRYRKASSFIREGIELLLQQEEEAALGVERGPAAKAVTEPEARRADRSPGQPSSVATALGLAVRPPVPVRSTGRAAGGVIPATRRECAVWVLEGNRRCLFAASKVHDRWWPTRTQP
jgi:Arc/MetJ-type ribon-helix-helix transcriptional regulator